MSEKNQHAQALGALGGRSTSEAKKRASRENGKKGGRKRKRCPEVPQFAGTWDALDALSIRPK